MKTLLSLSIAVLLLAGCKTTPVKFAQKAGIKTVHVEPKVDADQPMRYGVDLHAGLFFALGNLIVNKQNQGGLARMSGVMQSNNIVLPQMICAHVAEHLKQYPELQMTDENSDGVFVIKILQYGFDAPGQSPKKAPFAVLQIQLLDRNGKNIWMKQSDPDQLAPKTVGATWDEYEKDPKKLEADWDARIDQTVSLLLPAAK